LIFFRKKIVEKTDAFVDFDKLIETIWMDCFCKSWGSVLYCNTCQNYCHYLFMCQSKLWCKICL